MNLTETNAKSILRKQKKIDSWFISRYGMNLYRGCSHNCIYCDGRDEKYRVDGDFGNDISIKINAPQLLQKELTKVPNNINDRSGFILVGGGVNDCYQPVEKKYELTRQALELINDNNLPAHILTKSNLVLRDLELIKSINAKNRALVSFSFSSVDEEISSIVEPGLPSPYKRLEAIAELKKHNIPAGMFLMPVIPFLTDTPLQLDNTLKAAKRSGCDFVIFGGMTLKEGKQKKYFLDKLSEYNSDVLLNYDIIYRDDKWGSPTAEYVDHIHTLFYSLISRYNIPLRIPPKIYNKILDDNSRVVIMLEHLDYLHKIKKFDSPYGYAAYEISKLKTPLMQIRNDLRSIKGVGKVTERIIKEILNTGSSPFYEKMLNYR